MKRSLLLGGTILLLATAAVRAEDGMSYDRNHDHDDTEKYQAKEMTLDLFGSGSIGQQKINNITGLKVSHDVRFGVGLGMNYFFTRHIGMGGEAYTENTGHSFIDNASLSVIGRFPLGQSGFAPYVYGGAGRQFDLTELWFAQLGAGLEYRFTQKFGLFTDARYVLTDGTKNYGLGRFGMRFSF